MMQLATPADQIWLCATVETSESEATIAELANADDVEVPLTQQYWLHKKDGKRIDNGRVPTNVRIPHADPFTPSSAAPLDPDFMLQIFQRELPALADVPVRLSACRVRANKTHSAVGLTRVQIRYWVIGESTGQHWERVLLGTLPVTSDFLSRELLQHCHAAQGHPAVQPFKRLAIFIPQLQMVVQFFPVDVALPNLLAVTQPDSSRLLSRFIPECREGATVQETQWELVHYKPGERCVLKYTVRLSSTDAASFHRTVYARSSATIAVRPSMASCRSSGAPLRLPAYAPAIRLRPQVSHAGYG